MPGLFLAGEVAGTPLIKLGLNEGHALMERVAAELRREARSRGDEPEGPAELLDVLIVGAGSSGLAAGMRAHELGLAYRVVEAGQMAATVVNMYRGKVLFAEPDGVPNQSRLWFEECTREELLARWAAQVKEAGLQLSEGERIIDVERRSGGFLVTSDVTTYRARKVILAIGKAGNPRKAGVPGEHEHRDRVRHFLDDPGAYRQQKIFIYGGGDVACEAALALAETNDVTLVTLDPDLVYPKKRNADGVKAAAAEGDLVLHLGSRLVAIDDGAVRFSDAAGTEHRVENDLVFEMIGAELPLPFLKRIGVRLEGQWHLARYAWLAVTFVAVYALYALKKYPETPYSWPFEVLVEPASFAAVCTALFDVAFLPFRWVFTDVAYADMRGTLWFQTGYLYSLLYTLVMVGFGTQALRRWSGIARDPRYQRWRYLSLIAFQVGFFLLANVVAVQALSIQHAWRAWGLYQPWPLFFNTFHWWSSSDPRAVIVAFVGAGLFGTFVVIPLLSWKHGKRFCTWVCGCGGLAETLGDRWRHLSPKGERSRAWEFQNLVVLAGAVVVTVVTVGAFGTRADNAWAAAYAYVVDFWLVAVIPIALYPFYGGKVWCRYWCPLAAYNGLLARLYGRLRITANDRCISCTQCSRHCQVGVDVMAFAKNQEPFDNRNSSCIQCGICIDVCPMDVLRFDASPRAALEPERAGRRALPLVA